MLVTRRFESRLFLLLSPDLLLRWYSFAFPEILPYRAGSLHARTWGDFVTAFASVRATIAAVEKRLMRVAKP